LINWSGTSGDNIVSDKAEDLKDYRKKIAYHG